MELIILIVLLVNFAWMLNRQDKIIKLLETINGNLERNRKEEKDK
jgi:hypothetical protein